MQKVKDSFFYALRQRLAALNPDRTVVIDGVLRPAVLAVENERVELDGAVAGAFCLRWGTAEQKQNSRSGVMAVNCVIDYAVDDYDAGGNRQGRNLSAMDAELSAMLEPRSADLVEIDSGAVSAIGKQIFWGTPAWSKPETSGGILTRRATVTVFSRPEVQV